MSSVYIMQSTVVSYQIESFYSGPPLLTTDCCSWGKGKIGLL